MNFLPQRRRLLFLQGRELLNSEERFRLLVDSARDYAMFFLDIDNRIVDWNIGAERITGYRVPKS
jgi:PAS domain-containing protein